MMPNTGSMHRAVLMMALMALCGAIPVAGTAGVTELANGPLANGIVSSSTAKPNIAFVVDDSGSMGFESMPADDDWNDYYGYSYGHIRDKRCFGWYKHNTVFYNPNETYKPPYKIGGKEYSDGVTRYDDAIFDEALLDGYFSADGATSYPQVLGNNAKKKLSDLQNLTPFKVDCVTSGTGKECSSSPSKYYYSKHKTNASSTTCETNDKYSIVTDPNKIEAPGVTAGSDAAKTNYANWYTYYRSRAMAMKAAAGEAFKDLEQTKYRLGLFFINSQETYHYNEDFKIADFSGAEAGTQRFDWYDKLYKSKAYGGTPLRKALSRMGRMYAGKISGYDPVQYSCQQNFTILSTDGYWNDNVAPKQIDGSTSIGDVDGVEASAAVGAKARIEIGDQTGNKKLSNGSYRVTSVRVNINGSDIELMKTPPAPPNYSIYADTIGNAVKDEINANTSITGFKASYNNQVITITADPALGDLTAPIEVDVAKAPGTTKTRQFTEIAFSGYKAATEGTVRPYLDVEKKENTLADVAYYYYGTDLRDHTKWSNCSNTIGDTTYTDLCKNNVRPSGKNSADYQHMTTFTLGLGVNGTIKYEKNYETAEKDNDSTTRQYYDIKAPRATGQADWPDPTDAEAHKIDDLWHAAVNGRGNYYSAADSKTVKEGLKEALSGMDVKPGSSAAAATSNLEPVAGDNLVYVALYRTVKWDGDLKSFSIDPKTGALSGSALWSAQTQLDAQVQEAKAAGTGDGRNIKFFSGDEASKLKEFDLTNLTADSLEDNFADLCSKSPAVDQCGADAEDLTGDQKTEANKAENLINYLRGRDTYEDTATNPTATNRLYRSREHKLGDIVNGVPVYMKKPPLTYDKYDQTYAQFKTANAERAATVFIAANDGMLHAIDAETGNERWAYVPTFVMKNMWRLADRNYGNNHFYSVDGSPTVADVCIKPKQKTVQEPEADVQLCASKDDWRTILVAGLNKGGCGYYALDVTDPAAPKGLWEFTDDNLGYSFGNPVVGKTKAGKWAVMFSSGYNNAPGGCGDTGDGKGRLFVLDAEKGTKLVTDDIVTSAGSTTTPSGLGKLNAWIEDDAMPIIERLYGGDLLGNVWRFDIDNRYPPEEVSGNGGREAVLVAQLKDGTADKKPQPITTKPELAEIKESGIKYPVIMVGTGKYLGDNDPKDTSQQSLYALKDKTLTGEGKGIADVRGASMVARTLTHTTGSDGGALAGKTIRTISGDNMSWASKDGWYLDFNPQSKSPGERVNVDMSLQLNTLTVAANVPSTNACDVGGHAYLYFLNIYTGKSLSTAVDGMAGKLLSGNALVAGIKTVRVSDGMRTIVTDTTGNIIAEEGGDDGGGGGAVRRTTWREIED
ncbi:hypothetical protein GCM10027343_28920 [Noviherbaspirillum agri]